MPWLRDLRRWLRRAARAQAPPNRPLHLGRRTGDYVRLLEGHPGVRTTTVRILGGRATTDNALFTREHIETEDDAGNALQVDVFDARTCEFGHVLDQQRNAVAVCAVCGALMCSAEGCAGQCTVCGAACCARHRKIRDLGEGKVVTYCPRCSWKFWLW